MFVCLYCGNLFEEPKKFYETHGFTDGMYENYTGCPRCNGSYTETTFCDSCGKYITGKYIKTSREDMLCEHCYTEYDITDGVL